jgi:hypothetical protein
MSETNCEHEPRLDGLPSNSPLYPTPPTLKLETDHSSSNDLVSLHEAGVDIMDKTSTSRQESFYRGSVKEGEELVRHGEGSFVIPSVSEYKGGWVNDKKHGQGTKTWASGSKYVGSWQNDKRHGHGIYTWPDGNMYEGDWQDGKKHGQGTFTWANGNKYQGGWEHDMKHGRGCKKNLDGSGYVGHWKGGKIVRKEPLLAAQSPTGTKEGFPSKNKAVNTSAKKVKDVKDGYEYANLYDEAIPMLWASKLMYAFALVVRAGRSGEKELKFPAGILERYKNERLDLHEMNDGEGLPFNTVADLVRDNYRKLKNPACDADHVYRIIAQLQDIENEDLSSDSIFLESFSCIDEKSECVFGILKDDNTKRIIVAFRGSTGGTRDWTTNFRTQLAKMRTPRVIQGKMKGKLEKRVFVHKGFYEYLFDNDQREGDQCFNDIMDDIQPFCEDGYKLYVTGHSLGAGLASLLAFKLAGSSKSWIPKPITCITFASPILGTTGFRQAFHELEKGGLIRCLRITNAKDIVPALPPIALGWKSQAYKHIGINLRLTDKQYSFHHPNTSGINGAMRNSILKPPCGALKQHDLELHENRLNIFRDEFKNTFLNDLYNDKKIMGEKFVARR